MQFNSTIAVVFNTYNEVGEEVESSRANIRCGVLDQRKTADDSDGAKAKTYDLKVIIAARAFTPYNQILSEDKIVFVYEGKTYRPLVLTAIKNFSGVTKYYEAELKQVK